MQSLNANVSFLGWLERKDQAWWVEPTQNMGRTVPNRHPRSGDRPAPNTIEFEGWLRVSGVKSRRGCLIAPVGRSAAVVEQRQSLEDGARRSPSAYRRSGSRQHATVPPTWSPGAQRESARGPARQEVQFAVKRVAPTCPGGMLPVWLARQGFFGVSTMSRGAFRVDPWPCTVL